MPLSPLERLPFLLLVAIFKLLRTGSEGEDGEEEESWIWGHRGPRTISTEYLHISHALLEPVRSILYRYIIVSVDSGAPKGITLPSLLSAFTSTPHLIEYVKSIELVGAFDRSAIESVDALASLLSRGATLQTVYSRHQQHEFLRHLVTRSPAYPFPHLRSIYAYHFEQYCSVAIVQILRQSPEVERIAFFGTAQLGSHMAYRNWDNATGGMVCGANLRELFVPLDSSLAVHLAAYLANKSGKVHTLHLAGESSFVPNELFEIQNKVERLFVRHLDDQILLKAMRTYTPSHLVMSDYALDIEIARDLMLQLTSDTTHLCITVFINATWHELSTYLRSERCGLRYLRLHLTHMPCDENEFVGVEAICHSRGIRLETNLEEMAQLQVEQLIERRAERRRDLAKRKPDLAARLSARDESRGDRPPRPRPEHYQAMFDLDRDQYRWERENRLAREQRLREQEEFEQAMLETGATIQELRHFGVENDEMPEYRGTATMTESQRAMAEIEDIAQQLAAHPAYADPPSYDAAMAEPGAMHQGFVGVFTAIAAAEPATTGGEMSASTVAEADEATGGSHTDADDASAVDSDAESFETAPGMEESTADWVAATASTTSKAT